MRNGWRNAKRAHARRADLSPRAVVLWRVRDDGIGADTCGERQDFTGERNDRAVLERPRRSARIDHSPRNSVDADDVFAHDGDTQPHTIVDLAKFGALLHAQVLSVQFEPNGKLFEPSIERRQQGAQQLAKRRPGYRATRHDATIAAPRAC